MKLSETKALDLIQMYEATLASRQPDPYAVQGLRDEILKRCKLIIENDERRDIHSG